MKRPDVETVLAPMKPFQRRTVEHAFHRLFEAPDTTARFLVADEVGLGKTLVARGVIAKAIDHYWDDVDRIDVIYICSNQSIANSNLPKLQVADGDEKSFALATRLTMLATELAGGSGGNTLAESKVNFVSFTPGTSFNMGDSGGMAKERRVLFALLDGLVEPRIGLMNLMQGYVTRTKWWRGRLKNDPMPLDAGICEQFQQDFLTDTQLVEEVDEAIGQWFYKMRKQYPPEARVARNRILGRLRRMLADICVQALEPDLIILDEFQRFKSLLENRTEYADPAAELAQALFNAPTPEGHRTRTLLLSATPYKFYTADAEIEHEDHYKDFIDTTRFLYSGDEKRVEALQQALRRFGLELKRASQSLTHDVAAAKQEVERLLTAVMARTERVMASDERDAMLSEVGEALRLEGADVQQYLAADALFQAVGDFDPLTFWKSAPYLPHFMHGYKFNQRLKDTLAHFPGKVSEILSTHSDSMLSAEQLDRWEEIDPGNAKLRGMVHSILDAGLWKLLWIPPTIPYWPLRGAFEDQDHRTKTLLFSAWNVVPDVVSGLLSYEAERRMLGGSMDQYKDLSKQQSQLLDFGAANANRTSHRMLLLLTPCLRLADETHPLLAHGDDVEAWVRERVERLLADLPNPQEGAVDDRWEVAILRALDPGIDEFLEYWRDTDFDPESPMRPDAANFADHVQDLINIDTQDLGRRPEDLADLVTELALGAPGVLASRTLSPANLGDDERRKQAARLANSFWKLFNRPAVIRLLRQLDVKPEADDQRAAPYWRTVVRYCIQGNLQAVLDEYWHLVWEQHAWSARETRETISHRCVSQMIDTIEPRPSRVHASFYKVTGKHVEESEIRLRTVLALRFGRTKSEEGAHSQDAVRAAFNSPFRPFLLASTSVGQEGLDFHPWCHRLVHWDLPGNPVDMEQREGRVHRYKGHAVRRNVAAVYTGLARKSWTPDQNLWDLVFETANGDSRARGLDDLIPHWLAPGKFKIERRVPMLPYTREVEAFKRLKRQLAAYRVVFGQPRQEELLNLLDQSDINLQDLSSWQISLTPPKP
ncbi:helicase-related protein [Wenzhouxiangella sp. EGI_FJ10409]|uniref:helicase-related protein n=1 Tax=Wenzhouxiangella sp. EGI_FJ10409 TaxID=3243767 RepID=UPI0035DB9259